MKLGWTIAIVALLATSLSASATTSRLNDFIAAQLPESAAPGVAYARVEDGEILTGAFGERVAGSGDAITRDTPFSIGSVTKSFTALAIMQLVEA